MTMGGYFMAVVVCLLSGGCIVAINTGPGTQEIRQDAVASRLVHADGDGNSNTASNVTSGGGSAVIPLP